MSDPRLSAFPRLTAQLREQLLAVPPSTDHVASDVLLEYRPCVVSLRDGSSRDYVYVQDVEPWYAIWGVLPEEDSGKEEVFLGDVVAIRESPRRLPIAIATRLYQRGETVMGGYIFTLVVDDGREIPCLTGNAVDFVALPDDVEPSRVVDVRIAEPHGLPESAYTPTAEYAWCLYSEDATG